MPNRPTALNVDTDFLGTIPKGQMIVDFLNKLRVNPDAQIQMIALYGEWGSGKTSLMQWIKLKLPERNFDKVFFEAWMHEQDDNIALSMVNVISQSTNNGTKEFGKEICKSLGVLLKGLTKSITIDVPGCKINFDKIVQEADNYINYNDSTFNERLDNFKRQYERLEEQILGNKQDKKLVVFIDDLDRCEPENVLNLLSIIKLFFTFGQRTIFICGLDKTAINKAVFTKYKDAIKSDEYLEKIFDISFNMPKEICPDRLLEQYLIQNKYPQQGYQEEYRLSDFATKCITKIKFVNSRHLKKILNKFVIIKYLKQQEIGNHNLIPDLNKRFYVILTLFIIILYDFYPNEYSDIRDYDQKLMYYTNHPLDYNADIYSAVREHLLDIKQSIKNMIDSKQIMLIDWDKVRDNEQQKPYLLFERAFITFFSPKVDKYKVLNGESMYDYFSQFNNDSILSNFCLFIINNMDCVFECNDNYNLSDIFEMAELYL